MAYKDGSADLHPNHANPAWLGDPVPATRASAVCTSWDQKNGFKKRLLKTAWQLLVQHFIWTADRAGWKIGGNCKLCAGDLFYLFLGQLMRAFPDEYPVIIVRHEFLLSIWPSPNREAQAVESD
jgi:hypothetical protein